MTKRAALLCLFSVLTACGAVAGSAGDSPALCQIVAQCGAPLQSDTKVDCQFSVTDGRRAAVYANHAVMDFRGRSSLRYPKKGYGVQLRDAAGASLPTDLLGMGKDADWILDGAWVDRSFMRNPLVLDTFASFGTSRYGAESRFCTMSLNDKDQGLYRLGERIKRGAGRLDIAADDGTGASFIIKQDDSGILSFGLGQGNAWQMIYPKQETATTAERAGVQAWLDAFAAALNGADPGNAQTGVFTFLDVDTTIDWVLIQEFSKNIDAYNLSVHLARSAGGTARLVPWDFDLAFGQPTVSGAENARDNDSPAGWVFNRTPFIANLTKASALTAGLAPRWQTLRQGTLSDAAVTARLAAYRATLTPDALARNFTVWPLESVDFSQFYGPYSLYRVSSYDDEFSRLSAWVHARLLWMDAHIAGYPG